MNIITIDGPSASGKGTVSALVAQPLGWHVLDSGALYRISAYVAEQHGLAQASEQEIAALMMSTQIAFRDQHVLVNQQDVSQEIRQESIGKLASKLATYPALRQALLECQRQFYSEPGLVADGRDMGTVVFPHAPLKIFLVADVHERAKRRYKQLIDKSMPADFAAILSDLQARDRQDTERATAPLKAAVDAHIIDSSQLTIEATVAQILSLWNESVAKS